MLSKVEPSKVTKAGLSALMSNETSVHSPAATGAKLTATAPGKADPNEFAAMRADVLRLKELGVAGVVVGCLTPDGAIDEERMTALVEDAGALAVTCHRAFDMTADPILAVEALLRCGVGRVLTSGQHATAKAGVAVIKAVVEAAAGRLVVMACGGLNQTNIARIRRETGAPELHFAAQKAVPSGMTFRNPRIGMGGTDLEREYTNWVLDEDGVRRVIAAVRGG